MTTTRMRMTASSCNPFRFLLPSLTAHETPFPEKSCTRDSFVLLVAPSEVPGTSDEPDAERSTGLRGSAARCQR